MSEQLKEQLVSWRRDFHQHPETGYEEFRTSTIVARHLESLGLEVTTQVGKTGVVGLLRGEAPGPTIGLRADMDALPIQDLKKDVSYASQINGKGHLCGHDAHTSMLMGAAQLLTGLGRPQRGNIKFIFQPAEEGLAGAKAMMDDGVLQNPQVDAIAGIHVYPGLPTGAIGGSKGIAFASADPIEITIFGKGGHAARPHEGVDAIAVSAQVITALQNVTSRMIDPLEPAVVTIGKIEGGDIGTAIASTVRMVGTVRTLSPAVRDQMPVLIEQVIQGVTRSFGAQYELIYDKSYPAVRNNEGMVDFVTETSQRLYGKEVWRDLKPSTGGEDFAFYSEAVPGVFFRLGVGDGEERTSYPLHHPLFDLDENALQHGTALLSAIALRFLAEADESWLAGLQALQK
ncbi:M20 family metallopeptidase [Paenibacillus enshidis]|uniref:M20 family metallopeptidase n=1 Tax=Paenibacillus enshidis TaxID=1458439 RepID=A0ABV5AQ87_9BACL